MKPDVLKRAVLATAAIIAIAFSMIANPVKPGTSKPSDGSSIAEGKLKKEIDPSKRPRVPSRIYLEYLYDGNGILIIAPEMYPEIETSVTGKNVFYGVLNDSNGFYLETGSLEGAYVIVCTTNDGSVFSGELIVD